MTEVEDGLDLIDRTVFVQVVNVDSLTCVSSCPHPMVMVVEVYLCPWYRLMVFQSQFSMKEDYSSLPFDDVRLPGRQIAPGHGLTLGGFL